MRAPSDAARACSNGSAHDEPPPAPPGAPVTPGRVLRAIGHRLYTTGESRVYRMPAERARALSGGDEFARDAVGDFAAYQPDNAWDLAADEQRAVVAARLKAGAHCYTLVEAGRVLHHSYLTAPASTMQLDYGLGEYPLPPRSAKLWDDNTHTAARGRGLHQASLRRRARDAANAAAIDWVYICVRADNGPSRHNIEKVGFEHVESAAFSRVVGVRLRSGWMPGRTP